MELRWNNYTLGTVCSIMGMVVGRLSGRITTTALVYLDEISGKYFVVVVFLTSFPCIGNAGRDESVVSGNEGAAWSRARAA